MGETTEWGFPKGQVAQTLRKILSPQLSDHDVEAIVVCLLSHLLVEFRFNRVLYHWLRQDAPVLNNEDGTTKAEDRLLKQIVRMGFSNKWEFIRPFFEIYFPDEVAQLKNLNELRNHIFHGRAIEDAKFLGHSISDEETIEKIFLAAQRLTDCLDKYEEMVDAPHARLEKLESSKP